VIGGAELEPCSGSEEAGVEAHHGALAIAHTTARCLLLDRAGRIVYANAAAHGAMPAACDALGALLHRDEDLARIRACIDRGEGDDVEVPLRTRDGVAWHAVTVRPVPVTASGAVVLLSALDVDGRRAAEDEARCLAYRDRLTGLPNRIRFLRELERRLLGDEEADRLSGLLVVDLERFRHINDSFGYEVGDAVLVELARRLLELAGPNSLVGRLDGDEFVVATASGVEPEELARRLLQAMANPVQVVGDRLHVSLCIGVCHCPEHGRSVGDLMGHAEVAMATAKRLERGYCVFDAEMGREIRTRLVLEHDLARGVKFGQFEAHYQPRISLANGRIVGFEALARWRHPERGLLLPGEFIEVAEETGLITGLGTAIMLEAMEQQRAWARAGHDVTVSINVSARQLVRRDLLAVVAENIARSDCDPTRIELEITESALIGDADEVARTLSRIVALGIRIAVDDFGTGYSNLAYLHRYPLATLKIDRAFVGDSAQSTLLETIIGMGRALELELVAEGVERIEQASWLAARGVEQAQGFYYGRAMEVAEATACLGGHWPHSGFATAA